jgi:D-alanine-D-alanine ligase
MGVQIALLYNLAEEEILGADDPPDRQAELDSDQTVFAIRESLQAAGHQVRLIAGKLPELLQLQTDRVDIAFNICEGYHGRNREAHVPAVLEMLGVPMTGSDVLTLAACLDKPTTKMLLLHHRVPTPRFQVFYSALDVLDDSLRWPLIVKPAHEGSSMGISSKSRVTNEAELRERVAYLKRHYRQPALVEEFIVGREFTVGVLGNGELTTLPVMEISFDNVPAEANGIYSYQYKREWTERGNFLCPAPIDEFTGHLLAETAKLAFRVLGCRDFGRVDFRLSQDGIPYVIEVNPLPGLAPGYSDFPVAAQAGGISYGQLINLILNHALERYQIRTQLLHA